MPEQSKLNRLDQKELLFNGFMRTVYPAIPANRLEKAFESWLFQKPLIPSVINFKEYTDFLRSERSNFSLLKSDALAQIEHSIQDVYSYQKNETCLTDFINFVNDLREIDSEAFAFLRTEDVAKLLKTASQIELLFVILSDANLSSVDRKHQLEFALKDIREPYSLYEWDFDNEHSLAIAS